MKYIIISMILFCWGICFAQEVAPVETKQIKVIVKDQASGNNVENVTVLINSSEIVGQPLTSKTDSDGIAKFDLPLGKYFVSQVLKPGFSLKENSRFTVEGEKEQTIVVVLKGDPVISGTVYDPHNQPAAGVKVKLFPRSSSTETDEEGKFVIKLTNSHRYSETPCLYVIDEENNQGAFIEGVESDNDLEVKLEKANVLKARVLDENGDFIKKANISITLWTGNYGSSITHKSLNEEDNGEIELNCIIPGTKYSLNISADDFGSYNKRFSGNEAESGVINFGDITLRKAQYTLRGKVINAETKESIEDMKVYAHGNHQPNIHIKTDSEGRFELGKVCKGEISISGHKRGENLNVYMRFEVPGDVDDIILLARDYGRRGSTPLKTGKDILLEDVKIDPNSIDKPQVICFVNLMQRSSRRTAKLLAERASEIHEMGYDLKLIHVGFMDEEFVNSWKEENIKNLKLQIPDLENQEMVIKWVKRFPWFVITDAALEIQQEMGAFKEIKNLNEVEVQD